MHHIEFDVLNGLRHDLLLASLHRVTSDLGQTESWHITLPNLHLKLCMSDCYRD